VVAPVLWQEISFPALSLLKDVLIVLRFIERAIELLLVSIVM
jgi:hypothetical protein